MSDNQPEVKELGGEPEVIDLGLPFQCVWCNAPATRTVDGNSCCPRHFQTAVVWATAKRANRAPHPGCYPRRTPKENPDEPKD